MMWIDNKESLERSSQALYHVFPTSDSAFVQIGTEEVLELELELVGETMRVFRLCI